MWEIATRQISEPLSHKFFKPFYTLPDSPPNDYAECALWANYNIAIHFFHGFLPHMVSYAKFILMELAARVD